MRFYFSIYFSLILPLQRPVNVQVDHYHNPGLQTTAFLSVLYSLSQLPIDTGGINGLDFTHVIKMNIIKFYICHFIYDYVIWQSITYFNNSVFLMCSRTDSDMPKYRYSTHQKIGCYGNIFKHIFLRVGFLRPYLWKIFKEYVTK